MMLNFNLERLKRLPFRPDTVWQGGWHELTDLPIRDLDLTTTYHAGMWVCADTNIVGPGRDMLHAAPGATPEKLLDLMVSFAAEPGMAGYRPGEIQLADAKLVEFFTRELAETEIKVTHTEQLPAWELTTGDFAAYLSKGPGGSESISIFADPDVSLDRIISFGEAAAEFKLAAKWHEFSDQDLIRVVAPDGGPGLAYTVILGWSGIETGLGFYAHAKEHDQMHSGASPEEAMDRETPLWIFSFNDRRESGFRDLCAEWSRMGMPLAGEDAYPLVLCRRPGEEPCTAGPGELEYLTGLLLALARTTTQDADQGRWSVVVPVGDRKVEYKLELPYVLEPLRFADARRWNLPLDPRATEGLFEAMGTLFDDTTGGDHAATSKELNDRFAGKATDEIMAEADLPQTPARAADKLCYEAYDAIGYRKQVLARQALAVDPDCIRAWNLLGEENSDLNQKLAHHVRAIAASRKRFDLAALYEEWGDLTGPPELRPSMRALGQAAVAAEQLGQLDEALEFGLEFLACSPADAPELRHFVVGRLLAKDRIAEADHLLAQWHPAFLEAPPSQHELQPDTFMKLGGDRLFVATANLILATLQGLDKSELTEMRQQLRTQNRYLLAFLDKDRKPPTSARRNLGLGGGAVALLVGTELGEAWENCFRQK